MLTLNEMMFIIMIPEKKIETGLIMMIRICRELMILERICRQMFLD